jgi:hypothetical protein
VEKIRNPDHTIFLINAHRNQDSMNYLHRNWESFYNHGRINYLFNPLVLSVDFALYTIIYIKGCIAG